MKADERAFTNWLMRRGIGCWLLAQYASKTMNDENASAHDRAEGVRIMARYSGLFAAEMRRLQRR